MKHVMCGTCGVELDAESKDEADARHLKIDGAHEAGWYEDGDVNKPVW